MAGHAADMTAGVANIGLASYRGSLLHDRQVLFDRYQLVDWALKVVGVGSVGLIAVVVLLDEGADEDPVFLQVKQAEASVLERFLPARPAALERKATPASASASAAPSP